MIVPSLQNILLCFFPSAESPKVMPVSSVKATLWFEKYIFWGEKNLDVIFHRNAEIAPSKTDVYNNTQKCEQFFYFDLALHLCLVNLKELNILIKKPVFFMICLEIQTSRWQTLPTSCQICSPLSHDLKY